MTSKRWLAVLLLVVFGAARLPFEQTLETSLRAAHFREGADIPNDSMREKLGQLGAAAALGGFRSFLATMFELQATTAYMNEDFDSVARHYHLSTQLQPRETGYWEMAGWMIGFNASSYYLNANIDMAEDFRQENAKDSVEEGQRFLEDGLRYTPDSYELNRALGNLFDRRKNDFCAAAEAYGRAANSVDSESLAKRHHAYNLAYCPGRDREGYDKLLEIFLFLKGGDQPVPDHLIPPEQIILLKYLELRLNIPEAERITVNVDLQGHYDRLRRGLKDIAAVGLKQQLRLERLEHVLNIPPTLRIPFEKPLRHGKEDATSPPR